MTNLRDTIKQSLEQSFFSSEAAKAMQDDWRARMSLQVISELDKPVTVNVCAQIGECGGFTQAQREAELVGIRHIVNLVDGVEKKPLYGMLLLMGW